MSTDAFILLLDVHKAFEGVPVLRGVTLEVHAGETLCVIGESGCGKTVLLKHIIGLLHPEQGHVMFDGNDLAGISSKKMVKLRTCFGMVFQGGALFDSLTVGENVAFPLREHTRWDEAAIHARVIEKLSLLGMAGAEDRKPAELSGGMQKRVALARAIALEPDVVLYDEPTTGLDPIMADVINELIIRTHDHLKTTSIVVTHDMVSARKVADRVVMLHEGKVIIEGTPAEIQNSDNPVVRQFIEGRAGDRIASLSNTGSKP